MFASQSVGLYYAGIRAMAQEVDMGRNNVPFITCEGRCSKERVTFTTHRIMSERYEKELDAYQQFYACTICNKQRLFGLCESRQTLMGVRN